MAKMIRCPKNSVRTLKTRSENLQLLYILLPVCVELEHDVFFNILKNLVGRVAWIKLEEHYMDNAFISGMTAEEIIIHEEDISSSWKINQSSEASVRKSKMLGYWSKTHCPTFSKIFFCESQPLQERIVKLKSKYGTKTMTSGEVHTVISPKMECAIVKLNISKSTVTNLKHFVCVPINEIEVYGEVKMSAAMTSYNIKDEYLSKCWAALERGEWLVDDGTQVGRILFTLG